MVVAERWEPAARVCVHLGDTLELLRAVPDGCAQLVVTSPPYNLGKRYERRRPLAEYLAGQQRVIDECVRVLAPGGSICWQVGNHVADGEVVPLDAVLYPLFKRHEGLRLRNRIVWHFEHGLHCARRFSGRHETILWFTKGEPYRFDLDPVRVPQKYPGKRAWKGPRAGEYSGNPRGKNPGDVWAFPNVKANHIEKTIHPCQFPVELVERLVLALTAPGDLVLDPYLGVGTSACAAVLHGRRAAGAEMVPAYVQIARERITLALRGALRIRPRDRPVHVPDPRSALARRESGPAPGRRRRRARPPAAGMQLALRALGGPYTP
ncbi:MAG TPA: site-specific DNA-methyltransferase [Candidatus Binatia bacterium]|nr:site-specific DNA-methyltransferase [Candidatus Binatia bacterium]